MANYVGPDVPGFGTPGERIARLREQNAALRAQVAALTKDGERQVTATSAGAIEQLRILIQDAETKDTAFGDLTTLEQSFVILARSIIDAASQPPTERKEP